MEDASSTVEDDHFLDALEDFHFYDSLDCSAGSDPELQFSPSHSASALTSSSDSKLIEFGPKSPSKTVSSFGLRRRRSFGKHDRGDLRADASANASFGASFLSEVTVGGDGRKENVDSLRLNKNEERTRVNLDLDGTESSAAGVVDSVSEEKFGGLVATSANGDGAENSCGAESSTTGEIDEDQTGILFFLVELIIKAIGFQLNLMVAFVTFPFWVFYTSYMFMLNPFVTIQRCRGYLLGKITKVCNLLVEDVAPSMSDWFRENNSVLKIALRCGWGLFWSAYVCSVLVGLLITAFVGSGLIMRCLVEEPFHLKHSLNFDVTENKPVAVVPIAAAWPNGPCLDCVESIQMESSGAERIISPNRKLQVTVKLTLPESDYNRKLGMFQIRIEFVSANGKTLAILRQPCMLRFRSEPIRLLQTFFKIPLVAGYLSESQTLRLKFRGFTEGDIPTSYLKVIIEQRAEFRPAGGIPEVYDAALLLESELPLLKSVVWSWRKTLFVWLSMLFFIIELLFTLVCCRTVVMPTFRLQGAAAAGNTATPTLVMWNDR